MTIRYTPEQVAQLNALQMSGDTHPYTCANRDKGLHPYEAHYGDHGALRATEDGWMCRFCDYTQPYRNEFGTVAE